MKTLLKASVCVAALIASISSSHAIAYNVNTLGTYLGIFPGNTPSGADQYYKANNPNPEEGSQAGVFNTVFSNGGLTATITWTGSQPTLSYLYVKTANEFAAWNIKSFNLGTFDSIVVNQDRTFNDQGVAQQISHVDLDFPTSPGPSGGPGGVPDGGMTLTLLGMALAGLGAMRRFISR
jgi:hypothetical protein